MFEVTILAILQGVAEFLPISSSGHLVIAQNMLGVNEPGMRLDVFLHLGTLVAIFVYYWRAMWTMALNRDWRYALKLLASALPAVVVYFLFHDFIDAMFENVKMVGALEMFTGAVLIGTRYLPRGQRDVSLWRAVMMGLGQALALLPGVSRSGMTLCAARGGRIDAAKAAEFSFLMSSPLIAGAALLEILKSFHVSTPQHAEIGWALTLYGAAVAAVVGYFSLVLLVRSLKGRHFWCFGIYCIAIGLFTLLTSHA